MDESRFAAWFPGPLVRVPVSMAHAGQTTESGRGFAVSGADDAPVSASLAKIAAHLPAERTEIACD